MSDQSAFQYEKREDGIGVMTIDVPGEAQNTLKDVFLDEITTILEQVEQDKQLKGLMIVSGKPGSFVAGADITMLDAVESADQAEKIAKTGQDIFNRLENLPIPTVAAIDGACLGGGLELALACHQRVATDNSKTKLGLPEVQLGLLPGSGGTQRLPRLVGIAAALDLMLTGKQLNAKRAKKLGILDEVVAEPNLRAAAIKRLHKMSQAGRWSKSSNDPKVAWSGALSGPGAQKLALESNSFGRKVLFDQARKKLLSKTKGNYPAPEKIIESVEMGIEHGFAKGLEVEARYFGELVMSPQAKQLIKLFFTVTEMKKDTGVDTEQALLPIKRVAVLGGGLMGAGIASITAEKTGLPVRVKDVSEQGVNHALCYSWKLLQKKVKRRQYRAADAGKIQSRVTGTTELEGLTKTDLVVEAVFEDLAVKHDMVKALESITGPDTIFATNTSSIPIRDIAAASERKSHVIGMHYFSPVEKMPLLEIIKTDDTSDQVIATCVEFGKQQGKTVIVVNDEAGFYVNRILAPYMNEAGQMVADGTAIDQIDKALVKAGFPVGPITLLDEVGIDVATKVAPILEAAFGERMSPPPMFDKLKADDRKGRKNGRGFYRYDTKGKSAKQVDESIYQLLGVSPQHSLADNTIVERALLLMVNEAVRCLDEGIIRSAADGDIGAIFGIGFPPFLGGPFSYVDTQGADTIVDKLNKYADQYGERFKPASLLVSKAESGSKFY